MSRNKQEKKREEQHPFLSAFLFTENGKPKSGLGIYTFCLSILMLAVYALLYELGIRVLTLPLSGMPAVWSNLMIAALVCAAGGAAAWLLHRALGDKRLMFGAYLWMLLYTVLIFVTMLILIGPNSGFADFLIVFFWFVLLPVGTGLLLCGLLYRRDYHPQQEMKEPEWKKYVNRR